MNYKNFHRISLKRIAGLIRKEFILIMHDYGTIAMLAILPIMLLFIFTYAIEFDPKHLPTMIISYDHSPLTRDIISTLETSHYYKIVNINGNEKEKNQGLSSGTLSAALTIPANFSRKYIRGESPQLLVEIDGSDQGSFGGALASIQPIVNQAAARFNEQGLGKVSKKSPLPVNIIVQKLYNESNKSSFNIVTGLIGILLTLTMVMLTATAITSERESGTLEMLLTTPLTSFEIMVGKVVPYIIFGYLQVTTLLFFGKWFINIPIEGSILLLYFCATPFIIANLMIGMIFSVIAKTPMQAMQLSVFFQLPSTFLSGYIFSFYGMPKWAQLLGSCLPMTYFTRITRGILLKGNTVLQVIPNILPILFMMIILFFLTIKIFRTTLD
ncbi:MAG: ABC transporter permease [Legionella sp.]|uniref:ABC transporter permease n=1 Tax=Legionella sp. TaxID=459 RepID=UPI0039E2E76E